MNKYTALPTRRGVRWWLATHVVPKLFRSQPEAGQVWAKDKHPVLMVHGVKGDGHFYLTPINTHGREQLTREQLDQRLEGYKKVGEYVPA